MAYMVYPAGKALQSSNITMLNDILWRAIKRAKVLAQKESVGLDCQGGKRSDEAILLQRAKGKPVAWDMTVPDTFANSPIDNTATKVGAYAKNAASLKKT